jgi:hypothetical protein
MVQLSAEVDQWKRLEVYRQRYAIEDRLAPVASLEKSIGRRRMRSAALTRRFEELRELLMEVRSELAAVEAEIEGSRQTGALLIEEILDQVQIEVGEGWSPTPVLGYRVWQIANDKVTGNQVHWDSSTLESMCLREIPGEDLPHPVHRCGPPACGIYAVKDLEMFPSGVARGEIHDTVVGVVAMHGKVVEHEDGYRAQCATAVAVSANDGKRRLMTTDPLEIESLFKDPLAALAQADRMGEGGENPTKAFLEIFVEKENTWT